MRKWKIYRFPTFDDEDLCKVLNNIEAKGYKVEHILYIGENPENKRLYQIFYTKEGGVELYDKKCD